MIPHIVITMSQILNFIAPGDPSDNLKLLLAFNC